MCVSRNHQSPQSRFLPKTREDCEGLKITNCEILLRRYKVFDTKCCAPVVELVDALDSKSSAARRVGSSPTRGTIKQNLFHKRVILWARPPSRRSSASGLRFAAVLPDGYRPPLALSCEKQGVNPPCRQGSGPRDRRGFLPNLPRSYLACADRVPLHAGRP